jgi:hypothetical protein
MKLLTLILLGTAACLHAEVKVTTGDIDDRRTTGHFQSGLEIELKITGAELENCKGVRVAIAMAADDTGRDLQPAKGKTNFFAANDLEFKSLSENSSGFGGKKGEHSVKIALQNPARAAKVAKIAGNLEVLLPAADAKSVITVKLATEAGKPLANEAIKAVGAELTFEAIKGKNAAYKISDPGNKIAAIEFCTAEGTPLKTNGWSSGGGFGGAKSKSVTLEEDAPPGMTAKVYLLTEKSVVKIPLKLDAVPLP